VAAVRERAERQVDVVKVMASGGMVTAGTDVFVPQFSIKELWTASNMRHISFVWRTGPVPSGCRSHMPPRSSSRLWRRAVSRWVLPSVASLPS
jgi:hypothetical protein